MTPDQFKKAVGAPQPEVAVPCPRCLRALDDGFIWHEMVQPIPPAPPTGKDGSGPCCRDCAAAETIMRVIGGMDWPMARVAIGNDRVDCMRVPSVAMGLAFGGFMQPNQPGDFDRHLAWLTAVGLTEDPSAS